MSRTMTVTELADHLGITTVTLWNRCKRHGIVAERDPDHKIIKRFNEDQIQQLEEIVSRMRKHGKRTS